MDKKYAATATDEVFLKSQNWCRLVVCLNNPVKNAFIAILHNTIANPNINALPSDPAQLYNFMVNNKNKLMKLNKNKVLKKDQLGQLLPQEGMVFSDALDITLLRLLIQTFSGILNEDGHWKEPRNDDHSIAAAVFRAVNIRNKVIHHAKPTSMSDQEFNDIWCQIEKALVELGYLHDVSEYKTHDFDPILIKQLHSNMAEDFENILLSYKETCKNKDVSKVFVRRKFINVTTKKIVSNIHKLLKKHDSIMVSGEAGLGKTFSAKKMRYLWASGEIFKKNKLLYIDSKRVNRYMYKPSYAAPICVSELGDVLNEKTDEYLESFGCVKKTIKDLVVIIDGVDELSIKENNLDVDFLNKLQVKIDKNDEISAMETIIGIYFGLFFPGSKIIAFGRKNEVERLKGIQDQLQKSNLFNKQTRVVLELQPMGEKGVKKMISLATCNKTSCDCKKCENIYFSVSDVEFRNVPSHLMALIKIFEYLPDPNFGSITKTKIFIITIFNLLKNHTRTTTLKEIKTFKKFFTFDNTKELRECIQNIAKVSFFALLDKEVTIKVEDCNENGVDFFKYNQIYEGENISIKIKRDLLEQLDFFYVRDLEYYLILEPYHLINMEFLASCYIYCYPSEWGDLLLKLDEERKTMVLLYVAGLHSNEFFTKDFVSEVLQDNSGHNIQNYLSWLFKIEDVRYDLPRYECYGLKENGQLFPSFKMLDMINEEVDVFDEIKKRIEEVHTVVSYSSYNGHPTRLSLSLYVKPFVSCTNFKIIMRRNDLRIGNGVMKYSSPNIHLHKSNNITFRPYKTRYLDFEILRKWGDTDSRKINWLLNTISPPLTIASSNTLSVIQCKRVCIEDINYLNNELTEKLFSIVLSGAVDYISLSYLFFKDRQLEILKHVECMYTNKLINLELELVEIEGTFNLPKLGNRHIYLNRVFLLDDDMIRFKQHISPKYSYNFSSYKIIDFSKPFIRKQNYVPEYEQSMYLVLYEVFNEDISPKVFANTLSSIPSLAFKDDDSHISSSIWFSLSQIEDCRINEMRVWDPQSKNFHNFLNIKTNTTQFIYGNKKDLKELLDHIVNNSTLQLDKEIKVFVVKYDEDDWDCYEEKTLFGGRTIEELNKYYSSDNLLSERSVKNWCCEISQLLKENNDSVTTFCGLETKV